jgi:hypothetical protein
MRYSASIVVAAIANVTLRYRLYSRCVVYMCIHGAQRAVYTAVHCVNSSYSHSSGGFTVTGMLYMRLSDTAPAVS